MFKISPSSIPIGHEDSIAPADGYPEVSIPRTAFPIAAEAAKRKVHSLIFERQ